MSVTGDVEKIFEGPAALAERIRNKDLSPRELVELCLKRIDDLNPSLNAFRVTMAEEALAAADAMTSPEGPLAGVPIAIKDDLAVQGQSVTRGSRSAPPPAPQDSEAVRRLRAAGAIPIGVTNVPELTIWPWTATDANGITRNPWDTSRSPGGSSGGSAAAVASGMVPVAIGSDGGGSIRIPASCCGLVGMKPSRGRVSTQPYREMWVGLTVIGALTRTVRDSALLLDVMHGATDGDADSAPSPDTPFSEAALKEPGRLRIAVSRKVPPGLIAGLSPEQRGAWEQTARLLEQLGHDVIERDPPYGLASLEFTQLYLRGIYEDSLAVPDRTQMERSTKQMAGLGRALVPQRRRERLRAKRAQTTARILKLWNEIDVLLTPGLARTALPAEGAYGKSAPIAFDRAGRFTPWTPVFNLTGQPAITLPAGTAPDGLPLSIQLVGRPGGEDTLYSLGAQIEAARPWADHRPATS